ncbi:cell wall protein DAN4-like [Penaeus monodon]|uniref:cell wall protein DAN4-like n=1 Tax=Penaeus monodon TaxID=6687 RepID=UPI0018A72DFC|nr:cell wall protein DAN4-like [Penaeus monodon]
MPRSAFLIAGSASTASEVSSAGTTTEKTTSEATKGLTPDIISTYATPKNTHPGSASVPSTTGLTSTAVTGSPTPIPPSSLSFMSTATTSEFTSPDTTPEIISTDTALQTTATYTFTTTTTTFTRQVHTTAGTTSETSTLKTTTPESTRGTSTTSTSPETSTESTPGANTTSPETFTELTPETSTESTPGANTTSTSPDTSTGLISGTSTISTSPEANTQSTPGANPKSTSPETSTESTPGTSTTSTSSETIIESTPGTSTTSTSPVISTASTPGTSTTSTSSETIIESTPGTSTTSTSPVISTASTPATSTTSTSPEISTPESTPTATETSTSTSATVSPTITSFPTTCSLDPDNTTIEAKITLPRTLVVAWGNSTPPIVTVCLQQDCRTTSDSSVQFDGVPVGLSLLLTVTGTDFYDCVELFVPWQFRIGFAAHNLTLDWINYSPRLLNVCVATDIGYFPSHSSWIYCTETWSSRVWISNLEPDTPFWVRVGEATVFHVTTPPIAKYRSLAFRCHETGVCASGECRPVSDGLLLALDFASQVPASYPYTCVDKG